MTFRRTLSASTSCGRVRMDESSVNSHSRVVCPGNLIADESAPGVPRCPGHPPILTKGSRNTTRQASRIEPPATRLRAATVPMTWPPIWQQLGRHRHVLNAGRRSGKTESDCRWRPRDRAVPAERLAEWFNLVVTIGIGIWFALSILRLLQRWGEETVEMPDDEKLAKDLARRMSRS
jgi:hypothetical protein